MTEYTKVSLEILWALAGGPKTVRQMVHLIYGYNTPKYASARNAVNFALKRLVEKGEVVKDGYGQYGAITYRLTTTRDNDGEDETEQ